MTETQLATGPAATAFAAEKARGYSEGMAAARRQLAADTVAAEQMSNALAESMRNRDEQNAARAAAAAAALRQAVLPVVTDALETLVDSAFTLAGSITALELDAPDTRARSIAARVLAGADTPPVSLHASPTDVDLTARLMGPDVQVIADPSLAPGDFKAFYPVGWLDGIIEAAAARVGEELRRQLDAR